MNAAPSNTGMEPTPLCGDKIAAILRSGFAQLPS
jgi:hypothetical protein